MDALSGKRKEKPQGNGGVYIDRTTEKCNVGRREGSHGSDMLYVALGCVDASHALVVWHLATSNDMAHNGNRPVGCMLSRHNGKRPLTPGTTCRLMLVRDDFRGLVPEQVRAGVR